MERILTVQLSDDQRRDVDVVIKEFVMKLSEKYNWATLEDWHAEGHNYAVRIMAIIKWDMSDIDALVEERLAILAKRGLFKKMYVNNVVQYFLKRDEQ